MEVVDIVLSIGLYPLLHRALVGGQDHLRHRRVNTLDAKDPTQREVAAPMRRVDVPDVQLLSSLRVSKGHCKLVPQGSLLRNESLIDDIEYMLGLLE